MADEHDLVIETHLPITFTKATGDAFEQGQILKMTDPMTAALGAGDGDICAGVVHTEVTAAAAKASVSIYRGGIFRATAGVAGVTLGECVQMDASTSPANRLVDCDANSEQMVGVCFQTAASGARFLYELGPFSVDQA